MGKAKGIISEKEWEVGTSTGSPENVTKILEVLKKIGAKGMNMREIGTQTNITWPYKNVRDLVKANVLEEKKIGKANYFRIKVKRE